MKEFFIEKECGEISLFRYEKEEENSNIASSFIGFLEVLFL